MSNNERRLYEFGEFRLDPAERLLSRRGVNVPLTPKAADLLVVLIEQPGRLLDKDTLLAKVWPDTFVEENNLADNVFKLRRALGDGENGARFIDGSRGFEIRFSSSSVASASCRRPALART